MKFGSLFSGIGGLDLGLERAGLTCAWQVEINDYCRQVLAKHWPAVTRYGDVSEIEWADVESVEVVCGGFPCQPVSRSGLRQAQDDERWLWPEFFRCVRHLRPRYVIVENVPGLLDRGLTDVLSDLASIGYDAEWDCLPAAAFGLAHIRFRLFLVAYPAGTVESEHLLPQSEWVSVESGGSRWRDRATYYDRVPEPEVDRVAHGVPLGVVRPQNAALGNAVCPPVPELIGQRLIERCA